MTFPGPPCVRAKSLPSCRTLCDPVDCSPPGSCPGDPPGNDIGGGRRALPRGPSRPGGRACLACLLPWQAGSLPPVPPGGPRPPPHRGLGERADSQKYIICRVRLLERLLGFSQASVSSTLPLGARRAGHSRHSLRSRCRLLPSCPASVRRLRHHHFS